ncbi:DUF2986 domain-containing protein [Pelagibaculum spongiae]|uniref:DUF2986 domain-containing protein n=1 Tax=Pelagibaculum spongiae TaxID=2080658 RepID=UPI001314C879|nr:DUF2986 domain-containing protein [Pelagibaculum spongiae]
MSRKNKITAKVKARIKKTNLKNNMSKKPRYVSIAERAQLATEAVPSTEKLNQATDNHQPAIDSTPDKKTATE